MNEACISLQYIFLGEVGGGGGGVMLTLNNCNL